MPAARSDDRNGVVYTPPEVAGPIVRQVLEPRVRGRAAREILEVRVCDPAIGAGAFLIEVVDVLAAHLVAAWERDAAAAPADRSAWPTEARRQIAATCIAGVDVDAAAVAQACTALCLPPGGPLRVADALELDWRATYPDVFARGGFDVVVGNPPYIRQERLAGARRAGKATLARFASFDATADLYVYFLELAHQVLRPGGAFGLIVPNKWMTVAYGRRLRAFLAAQGSVDGVVDLSRAPLFSGADAFPCIVWGSLGATASRPIRALRPDAGTPVAAALAAAADAATAHPRARWMAEPWHIETPAERALLDRLEATWPPLGEVVPQRPSRGVVTGLNRAFVIDRATRDRLLAAAPAAAPLLRPFVKGRDVRPYVAASAERWILLIDRGTSLDALPAVRAHLEAFREALEPRPPGWTGAWRGRKPGAYAWYELQDPVGPLVKRRAPRLLYQDIQTAPACSLDRDGALVPDTTVWMLPTDDRFVLALLNSPLYAWYARRRFPPALNGAVRPKLAYLRTLPVARPTASVRAAIEELVERRLAVADTPEVRDLDAALARAFEDAYELSAADRRLIRAR